MAASLGSMVEGILDHLYGHSATQDASTELNTDIAEDALSFTVDDSSAMSRGLIEVDTELMDVKSVDLTSGAVSLYTRGRGVRGSTAAAHTAGARVRISPVIPYHSVVREVNAELAALFPRICAVASTEFDASATTVTYDLPADAVMVLDVRWRNSLGEWERVRQWGVDFSQNTTDHATGTTVKAVTPDVGKIRVIYGKPFASLGSLDETLESVGVQESLEDVIRMGAALRLLPSMDLARLSVISVPAADANNKPPQPGTGITVAREIRQQYTARLVQEIGTFRLKFPVRVHITR